MLLTSLELAEQIFDGSGVCMMPSGVAPSTKMTFLSAGRSGRACLASSPCSWTYERPAAVLLAQIVSAVSSTKTPTVFAPAASAPAYTFLVFVSFM